MRAGPSLIFVLVLAISVAGFFYYNYSNAPKPTIEEYVRTHISELSPEKAVLGGTLFVTAIEAHGGAGSVEYEDGHNAFVADFVYLVDEQGNPSVTSFVLR